MTKKILTLSFLSLAFFSVLQAQSTGLKVYQIFQEKCVACHDNDSPQSGLDLEGSGFTPTLRFNDVYNNIVGVTPSNSHAAGEGYQYIFEGRPDKSFLFRKANQGLEQTITIHQDEGGTMPPANQAQLTDVEKEMIRQWILYGAPQNGEVVDQDLIETYYSGQGLASFDTPPPAPDPSEGFQIKMGPFYLQPQGQSGDELEYYQKYALDLPADVDVDRIDIKIAPSSHHFILYDFAAPFFASSLPAGLRLNPDHSAIGLVAAVQESTDLRLPQTTAFMWDNNIVLDLNSHYINYSATMAYQAEAYVNVYTKPSGTAEHEMKTELIVKDDIAIFNNGNTIMDTEPIYDSSSFGDIYIWGLMGHTHKYGTGYKMYERDNGQEGELIYDAACPEGIPGCVSPFFDYQHIPIRYFEPLLQRNMSSSQGLIHTAWWVNNGPETVYFGPTSDDEMMVAVIMYTENEVIISSNNEFTDQSSLTVYPNPMSDVALLQLPDNGRNFSFRLFDLLGQEVRSYDKLEGTELVLKRDGLTNGMYVYSVLDDSGNRYTGKLMIE